MKLLSAKLGAICTMCTLLYAMPSTAADRFVCIQEEVSGFVFKSGDWLAAPFKNDGRKLIVRELEEGDDFYGKLPYLILDASDREIVSYCLENPQAEKNGFIQCESFTSFTLYIDTGRYFLINTDQLLTDKKLIQAKKLKPTPNIEIGECTEVKG